jgi:formate hydrogenlyase subunit 4
MISSPSFVTFFAWLLVMLVAPLTIGIIRTVKARYQNRKGASVFQPYRAIGAMFRKEMTIPEHSSWVFRFVPYAVLAATLLLALIVPTLSVGGLQTAATNIFFVAALAALASVFLVLGGMDTGSTFGNMGSSREMTLVALAEPAFFVILATLGYLAHSGSVDGIVLAFMQSSWLSIEVLSLPVLASFLLILLAENARYPVDNPATHLELTMVHEAMILEYSGPFLAMLEYASALRLTVMGVFFMNLVLPWGILIPGASVSALGMAVLWLFAKAVLFAILIASIESLIVKMRFYRMQEYFSLAFLLAVAGAATAISVSTFF